MRMNEPLRKVLVGDLARRQLHHPQFSMRAYARYLGLNPTSLSLYLRGKRELDAKSIEKVRGRLVSRTNTSFQTPETGATGYVQIEASKLRILSDWHYFAILSLMETTDYVDDPDWIARRLGLTVPAAKKALETLEACAAIVYRKGRRFPAELRFRTSDGVRDLAVQRSHLQALDLARMAIETEPVELRNFSAITLALDPKLIPEAARRITRFRRSLAKFLEQGKQTEVYRMSFQLFPLSKPSQKSEELC